MYICDMITDIIIEHINSLKPMINTWGKEAIELNANAIKEVLKNNQLSKGINSFGNPLKMKIGKGKGFYAASTQSFADKQGLSVPKTEGAPYNFQWTGDTFDSMGLKKIGLHNYDIFTIDGKQKKLERIYGEIFSLTTENNNWVNKHIIEPYIAKKLYENIFNVK